MAGIKAAILVVAPFDDEWLSLCLSQFARHTRVSHRVFVCATEPMAGRAGDTVEIVPSPRPQLRHFHGLQAAYERALAHDPEYIVTADPDSFPVAPGWDDDLIGHLEQGALIGGVWRNELQKVIVPYVHPSGLCIRTSTVREYELWFNIDNYNRSLETGGPREDTLSHFTRELPPDRVHKWFRSNRFNYHRLVAGVYGGYFYHHAAVTRLTAAESVTLHDSDFFGETPEQLARVSTLATQDLFKDPDAYFARLLEG